MEEKTGRKEAGADAGAANSKGAASVTDENQDIINSVYDSLNSALASDKLPPERKLIAGLTKHIIEPYMGWLKEANGQRMSHVLNAQAEVFGMLTAIVLAQKIQQSPPKGDPMLVVEAVTLAYRESMKTSITREK